MANKKNHRRMTSADQARYSESRYGSNAVQPLPMAEPRTGRRSSSGSGGSHVSAAPSRADGVEAYRARMLADYAAIRESLGGSGASRKVAAAMIRELRAGGAR